MNTHIMLDLETLGTGPDAAVVSIGAVAFDLNAVQDADTLPSFYERLNIVEQTKKLGRTIDARTFEWWCTQSDEARAVFAEPSNRVEYVLESFNDWVSFNPSVSLDGMWGNGVDFDNLLLGRLYDAACFERPWSYSVNRCFRTIKNLFPVEQPARIGTHHNALDDAKHQVRWLQQIMQTVRQ